MGRISGISSGVRGLMPKTTIGWALTAGAIGGTYGLAHSYRQGWRPGSASGASGLRGRSSGGVNMGDLSTTGNTLMVNGRPTQVYT